MLRVTIELLPQGDESRAQVLERVEILQIARMDLNPGGLRRYVGRRADGMRAASEALLSVDHRRDQGAARLAAKVLEGLPIQWEET